MVPRSSGSSSGRRYGLEAEPGQPRPSWPTPAQACIIKQVTPTDCSYTAIATGSGARCSTQANCPNAPTTWTAQGQPEDRRDGRITLTSSPHGSMCGRWSRSPSRPQKVAGHAQAIRSQPAAMCDPGRANHLAPRRARSRCRHQTVGALRRATFEPAVLVQFRDQDALDDLRRDSALRRLLRPLRSGQHDGLAKISPADLERVRALLRERGVEIEGEPPTG